MKLNTKLNNGDTIWYLSNTGIKNIHVGETHILIHPQYTIIRYNTLDGNSFNEQDYGKSWWLTREELIRHLTVASKDKPRQSHCQCNNHPDLTIEEEWFEMLKNPMGQLPSIEPPTQGFNKIFNQVFGQNIRDKKKTKPQSELNQLYDEIIAKK